MEIYRKRVEEAVDFLRKRVTEVPEVVLILGTGLGGLAACIQDAKIFPYATIPHFPSSTVQSHAGNLLFGRLGNRKVAALQGRFHFYEGYSTRDLTLPLRVLSLLGSRCLVVSNASGGLNPDHAAGSIMVIRDHLNFIPDNPLRGINIDDWGLRFPDLSVPYDPVFIQKTCSCAERLGIRDVVTGVYAAIPGPSLETPAETRFLRRSGADAVGMSTVPEVIVARHAGMKVLGLALLANVNDPDDFRPILLADILAGVRERQDDFQKLVIAVLAEMEDIS
ncbi:MAG: purine-nucleoside phosphorylase [Deltaproteobacteria bacterium RIFOXYD12_FULL_50_9]|nr:MAG: purine-nucleoside phosphorylase [Deltaproteobacteria bacterium RIFOXYD12_FULL_50_9]